MRILILNDLPPASSIGSGAERFITLLIESLTYLGHTVDFASFMSDYPDEDLLTNYDLVHVHNYSMASLETQKLLMSNKISPTIFTVHDYLYLCTRRHGLNEKGYPCPFVGQDRNICKSCVPFGHKVVDGLLESAQVIIADSERMAAIYRKHLPNSDVRSILLGVPSPHKRVNPAVKQRNSFLFMGRHSIEKGFAEMIAAFKSLNTMCPDTRLIITHEGHEGEALKMLVKRSGLSHKIKVTGKIKRKLIETYIADCVAVLAPSVWEEPFNLTVTEAWQHGKPVIASNIGAHEELIRIGAGGLLYEPYDIAEMASQMKLLFENPLVAHNLGRNGFYSIGHYFNHDRMARDYDALYKEVIQQ